MARILCMNLCHKAKQKGWWPCKSWVSAVWGELGETSLSQSWISSLSLLSSSFEIFPLLKQFLSQGTQCFHAVLSSHFPSLIRQKQKQLVFQLLFPLELFFCFFFFIVDKLLFFLARSNKVGRVGHEMIGVPIN